MADHRRVRRTRTALALTLLALGAVSTVPPAWAQAPVPVGPPVTGVDGSPVEPPPPTLPPVQAGVTTTLPVGAPMPTTIGSTTIGSTTVPLPAGVVTSTTVPPLGAATTPPVSAAVASSTSTTARPARTTTTTVPTRTPAELRERVRAILATVPGAVSAVIVIDGVGRVVEIDAAVPRPPASTLKVLTAGTALLALGAEHRFVTSVRAAGPLSATGVLQGDLILVGGGDPTLRTSDLNDLANQVAAAGIRTVTGRLVVDDARFEQMSPALGWKPSFVPGEVGRVSAFLVDGNHRNEPDPSVANLTRLKAALTAKRITVTGALQRAAVLGESRVVAVRSSQPLSEVVVRMLKQSNNTDAEVILREIGALSGVGSPRTGITGVERMVDRFGLARPTLYDGSGLSSANRVTADLLVGWLTAISTSKVAVPFRAALPVACVDGTLKGRMCATSAAGNLRAKTGYINGVVTLAGFATTASGRPVTFAVLGSELRSTSAARAAIDKAMVEVTASTL